MTHAVSLFFPAAVEDVLASLLQGPLSEIEGGKTSHAHTKEKIAVHGSLVQGQELSSLSRSSVSRRADEILLFFFFSSR